MVRYQKLFILVTVGVIILDQISKYIVEKFFPALVVLNTGAGFGILQDNVVILSIISVIAAGLIIVYYKKIPKENIPQTLFALLLGGIIGNGIDRIFRMHVIDFIDVWFWPIFNFADAVMTISVLGLIWYYWK